MSHAATNWAIGQRGFRPATKVVLWHLCDRYHPDHGCFPSQETLAEDCELSRSALNEHLAILENAGLIAREQRREKGSKQQLSTRYRFAFEAGFTPVCREKPCPESGHGSGDDAVSGNDAEPCPENDESRVRNPDSNPVREPVIEPVNEREGASERERAQTANAAPAELAESRDAIERGFKRFFPAWPTYVGDSEPAARKAWFDLTPAERAAAALRLSDYVEHAKTGGRKTLCSAGVYLAEKRWEKLPRRAIEPQKPELAKPCGKAWMAIWLTELHRPMVPESQWPPAPAFVRQMIEQGGELGRRQTIDRRERHGWPKVHDLKQKFADGKPVIALPAMLAIGAGFAAVDLAGPVGQAWQRLHDRLEMPWLPDEVKFAYFPPIDAAEQDLDKAVAAAFWQLRERIEGDVHAAAE